MAPSILSDPTTSTELESGAIGAVTGGKPTGEIPVAVDPTPLQAISHGPIRMAGTVLVLSCQVLFSFPSQEFLNSLFNNPHLPLIHHS
jgi:hypothetical protein